MQQVNIKCPLLLFKVLFLYLIIYIFKFVIFAKNNIPLNSSNIFQ